LKSLVEIIRFRGLRAIPFVQKEDATITMVYHERFCLKEWFRREVGCHQHVAKHHQIDLSTVVVESKTNSIVCTVETSGGIFIFVFQKG
jgi:hypothetical protein